MDQLLATFETFLRTKRLRLTQQRRQIARQALALHTHFTADSLHEALRAKRGGISKATVYRTLTLMAESNLLDAQDFGRGSRFYEHKLGHTHHDHMVCVKCNRIFEFKEDRIEDAQVAIARKHGFKPLAHALKIYGLCSKCRRLG